MHVLQTWIVPSGMMALTSHCYKVRNDRFPSQYLHKICCRLTRIRHQVVHMNSYEMKLYIKQQIIWLGTELYTLENWLSAI